MLVTILIALGIIVISNNAKGNTIVPPDGGKNKTDGGKRKDTQTIPLQQLEKLFDLKYRFLPLVKDKNAKTLPNNYLFELINAKNNEIILKVEANENIWNNNQIYSAIIGANANGSFATFAVQFLDKCNAIFIVNDGLTDIFKAQGSLFKTANEEFSAKFRLNLKLENNNLIVVLNNTTEILRIPLNDAIYGSNQVFSAKLDKDFEIKFLFDKPKPYSTATALKNGVEFLRESGELN